MNPLFDLSPLANLVNLKTLWLEACEISDLSPLENLTKLALLQIPHNQIQDITPLANLTDDFWDAELNLSGNRIVDVSPLVSLTRLEKLWIQNNNIIDHSPFDALSLTIFEYDEFCVFPGHPFQERIQNRSYPSVVQAW